MNMMKKINRIKFNAYKLHQNRQIPKYLFECIMRLNADTTMEEFKFYMDMSEHYLRVKGYYGKYAEIDIQAENDIKELQRKYHY